MTFGTEVTDLRTPRTQTKPPRTVESVKYREDIVLKCKPPLRSRVLYEDIRSMWVPRYRLLIQLRIDQGKNTQGKKKGKLFESLF